MAEASHETAEFAAGQVLKAGDTELFDIAEELAFDMFHLKQFAAHLLKDSGGRLSGQALLASLDAKEYTTVPSKTHALLKYW